MLAKFGKPSLLGDVQVLLPPDAADHLDAPAGQAVFVRVFKLFIEKMPGQRWARTEQVARELGLGELL